jgi:hypothetical protein
MYCHIIKPLNLFEQEKNSAYINNCTEWPLRGHFENRFCSHPKICVFLYLSHKDNKNIILVCQKAFNPIKMTIWVNHWCQSGCTWEKILLKVTSFNF